MVLCTKQFLFIKKIGQGSYGEVWLVRRKENEHKKYVLKKISFAKASEREMEAARQECQLLKRLDHPNIVQYKDSFEEDNSLYIAMAFCEDGDLYTKLKERKGVLLPENQIVEWLIQITMALSHIHEQNILHRDLKTQNVFLAKSIIKIGDLGIAKQLGNKYDMAKTIIGTPYYMSPELFAKKPYNFKSDIWSLGCVTYEMATLKHAFNAKNYTALSYKILNGQTPDIPKIYSSELLALIGDMLNKKPEKRPPTGKILCNSFIRHHIQIFVDNSKRLKISSKTRSQEIKRNPRDSISITDQDSSVQSCNDDPRKLPKMVVDNFKEQNKVYPPPPQKNQNAEDYDDNDDVVIIRSSVESHSKKSSESSQKENRNLHHKSCKSDLNKEEVQINEDIQNDKPSDQLLNDNLMRSKSMPQLEKGSDIKSPNDQARQRRRQKKRDQGLRTLFIGELENDDNTNSNQNNAELPNDIGNRRRRRKNDPSVSNAGKVCLPELRRVESPDEGDVEFPNHDELQMIEKMNETLNVNGIQNFGNIKDSILLYRNHIDSAQENGPIENEQETLDRTNFQNRRYQEIRKDIMKNVGWEKMSECFNILRDLDLDHDVQMKNILGEDYENYAGKMIFVKMLEEG